MQILTGKPPDQADRRPKTHPQRPENPFSAKYGRKFGVNAGAHFHLIVTPCSSSKNLSKSLKKNKLVLLREGRNFKHEILPTQQQ